MLDDSRLGSYDGVNRVNPAARGIRRRGAAPGAGRRVIDCRGHRSRTACRTGEVLRVLRRPARHAGPADRAVGGGVDHGGAGAAGLARVAGDEREPARIVGLDDQGRPLEVGEPANLVVVDPEAWTVDGTLLASRSANTPYAAMTLPATVTATLLRGGSPPGTARCTATRIPETAIGTYVFGFVIVVLIGVVIRPDAARMENRSERQVEMIGTLPPMPDLPGPAIIAPPAACTSGCTLAPDWLNRVTVGDLATGPRPC